MSTPPGLKGYKPISLVMDPTPGIDLTPVNYPRAKVLYLPAIKERVPVFEGKFRITQDLKISSAAEFSSSLGTDGKTFTINGKLDYQACDSKICYLADLGAGALATASSTARSAASSRTTFGTSRTRSFVLTETYRRQPCLKSLTFPKSRIERKVGPVRIAYLTR